MSMTEARRASAAEARAALARASLTIAGLARATGTSHGYWSKRLNGAVGMTVDDLTTIAVHTGVAAESLISGRAA